MEQRVCELSEEKGHCDLTLNKRGVDETRNKEGRGYDAETRGVPGAPLTTEGGALSASFANEIASEYKSIRVQFFSSVLKRHIKARQLRLIPLSVRCCMHSLSTMSMAQTYPDNFFCCDSTSSFL